jgi:general secretion pathway protein F
MVVAVLGSQDGLARDAQAVTESGASSMTAISLDELAALNDEIIALVRSGVPLEEALHQMGGDLPGRLGKISRTLAERMKRGESLADVLESEPELFPPVYRAVVLAGLRGGRLAAALESVSRSARRLGETRRMTAAGFVYPLLVVVVAWCLFILFTTWISRPLGRFFSEHGVPGRDLVLWLGRLGDSAWYWGPAVPVAILVLAWIWWRRSGRATVLQPRWSVRLFGWVPLLGRLLHCYRMVTFAEVLSLLVRNRVPLADGILLSAEATGDPAMIRAADEIADQLRGGRPLFSSSEHRKGFPPLLEWLMVTGQRHGALLPALAHASEIYEQRARRHSDAARLLLPIVLTIVIGGSVTLAYALLLFAPWVQVLRAVNEV